MLTLRVLEFASVDGPTSAAIDEALLESVGRGAAPPTLRLYTWSGTWLSIGSSQSAAADVDLEACRDLRVGVVRRMSGGTAMLNEGIVGFSVVVPSDHPVSRGGISEAYRLIASALVRGLASLRVSAYAVEATQIALLGEQPDFPSIGRACFSGLVPSELMWGRRKLMGFAQVRRKNATLCHGMLFIDFDAQKLSSVLRTDSDLERSELTAFLKARVATLRHALPTGPNEMERVAAALEGGLASILGDAPPAESLSLSEADLAASLVRSKYADPGWTFRR